MWYFSLLGHWPCWFGDRKDIRPVIVAMYICRYFYVGLGAIVTIWLEYCMLYIAPVVITIYGISVIHRLRIQILRILKFPEIAEFLRISKLSILKFMEFKLSYSSLQSSSKLFVANTALKFWRNIFVMSTVNLSNSSTWSWTAYYKVYESPSASLSSPVQNRSAQLPTAVPIHQLPQCNRLQIDCKEIVFNSCSCIDWRVETAVAGSEWASE